MTFALWFLGGSVVLMVGKAGEESETVFLMGRRDGLKMTLSVLDVTESVVPLVNEGAANDE